MIMQLFRSCTVEHWFCLYASETWTSLASDMKAIKSFHMKCQRRILGIRLHDFVRNSEVFYALVSHLCLTGLPEVAMPSSDMWQECQITLQHTMPCYAKSSYRSVDPQTLHGNVHQVDHVPNGPTNSVVTTTFPLRLCGGKPLVAVIRERRYGPSRLRVNDDDDVPSKSSLSSLKNINILHPGRWSVVDLGL